MNLLGEDRGLQGKKGRLSKDQRTGRVSLSSFPSFLSRFLLSSLPVDRAQPQRLFERYEESLRFLRRAERSL